MVYMRYILGIIMMEIQSYKHIHNIQTYHGSPHISVHIHCIVIYKILYYLLTLLSKHKPHETDLAENLGLNIKKCHF